MIFDEESEVNSPSATDTTAEAASRGQPAEPADEKPLPEWKELGLSAQALELIARASFRNPTPVQAASIPLALEGRDLIASAQTGTGKTASFVLPMVEKCAGREGLFGLILAPTREIAQQTQATLELFGTPRGVRSIVLIGGIDMKIDEAAIRTYPQIIVATPGRLCDHLDRGNIWLEFVQMVVLDEADRMLDMGFADQLARIMADIPHRHQTMVFSATFPQSVERLARKALHEPERVMIGKAMASAKSVEQRVLWVSEESKNRELSRLIDREPGSMIVFTRSKEGASRVWRSLHSRGVYDATYIHSDRRQSDRELALAEFKEGKYRILVATDVAGRGIHVEGVAHVVNYDLPLEPEDYVHRIGRTGRIGATGRATSFVTRRDRELLTRIERVLGERIPSLNEPQDGVESPRSSPSRGKSGHGHGHQQARSTHSTRASDEGKSSNEKTGGGKRRRRRRRSGGGGGGGGAGKGPSSSPHA